MKHSNDTNKPNQLIKTNSLPSLPATLPQTDKNIYLASITKTKFKDFDYNDDIELATILLEWATHLQADTDPNTIDFIINFLKSNFSTYNCIDIKYTMDLAISNQLGELDFYGKFSTIYVAGAIQKYRQKFRGKAIVDVRNKLAEMNYKDPDEKDSLYYFKENLKFAYEDAKSNMFYDYGGTVYKFLLDNKIAKVSSKIYSKAEQYAKTKIQDESRKLAISQTVSNSYYEKLDKEYLKTIFIRQYCVNHWLKSFTDKSFEKFLETIKVEPKNKK